MSNARFSILQAKAVKDKNITDAQFRTLAALGCYGDKDGWCYPSLKTLGKDLGKTFQAVGKDIAALVELGYVEKHHRFTKDGGQRSNLYRLKFDTPSTPEVEPPSTLEIEPPSTPEVEHNVSINNDPINDNDGADAPKTTTVKKAKDYPPVMLVRSVMEKYPARDTWDIVCDAVSKVEKRLGREPTKEDLLPFWRFWRGKGWSPKNLDWLTEIAVSGVIPTNGNGHNKQQKTYDAIDRVLGGG